jgi:hypothetical protein
MRNTVEIEDLEQRRLQAGIDDVELRLQIQGLRVGDFLKLTFLIGATSSETLAVASRASAGRPFGANWL